MKTKLLVSSLLMTGALMASGTASSATLEWAWTGTTQDWINGGASNGGAGGANTVIDSISNVPPPPPPALPLVGDGDTTFTFIKDTISPNTTAVTLKEEVIGNVDLYNVGLGWIAAQSTGSFSYKISTTDQGFNLAALDSIISGTTGDVTKSIYSGYNPITGSFSGLLLTLDSSNGSSTAFTGFPTYQTFYVVDTITAGTVNNINDIHNQFTVPEPMTLVMLGIGLVGFGYIRRNTMSGAKGLSA